MSQLAFGSPFGLSALSAAVLVGSLGLVLGPVHPTQAARLEAGKGVEPGRAVTR